MRPHRHLGAALALALLAGCAALAGCRAGGHPEAAASPSAISEAQMLEIGRQYAQCIRDHGITGFPDPVVRNGGLSMPPGQDGQDPKQALQNNPAAQTACAPILAPLPAGGHRNEPTPSAQDLQAMMRFSACMRDSGISEFPDPTPDGNFPMPTPLQNEGKSPRVIAALTTCNHFLPAEQAGK